MTAQCEGMGSRVGEVRAGTTSLMPEHKGFNNKSNVAESLKTKKKKTPTTRHTKKDDVLLRNGLNLVQKECSGDVLLKEI